MKKYFISFVVLTLLAACDKAETLVLVDNVTLDKTTLTLTTNFSYALSAEIAPIEASGHNVVWSSDNTSVVIVDQSGLLTTVSSGTAVITAKVGSVTGTCKIRVIAPTTKEVKDYEVDSVNYGKGIVIEDVIWAPVNCGYHTTDFQYGKLYQWGRKYGQGYDGEIWDYDSGQSFHYSDASAPKTMEGPISIINGQEDKYSNIFFTISRSPFDWASSQDDNLWNSGTESNPAKTEYDPCPEGWRVPTFKEIQKLTINRGYFEIEGDQQGKYYCGPYTYLDNAPKVFLPASGQLDYDGGGSRGRGLFSSYWSSKRRDNRAEGFYFYFTDGHTGPSKCANGHAVRCVQE